MSAVFSIFVKITKYEIREFLPVSRINKLEFTREKKGEGGGEEGVQLKVQVVQVSSYLLPLL